MADPRYVFLDDKIVPWDQGTVHVSSGAFTYGASVFEGLRGYWDDKDQEMYLFRDMMARDHFLNREIV